MGKRVSYKFCVDTAMLSQSNGHSMAASRRPGFVYKTNLVPFQLLFFDLVNRTRCYAFKLYHCVEFIFFLKKGLSGTKRNLCAKFCDNRWRFNMLFAVLRYMVRVKVARQMIYIAQRSLSEKRVLPFFLCEFWTLTLMRKGEERSVC